MRMISKSSEILDLDFEHDEPVVISIIGCGGKTTFMMNLARELSHKKVLVTTTTKIKAVFDEDVHLCKTIEEALNHTPQIGIQCMGMIDYKTNKLSSLPIDVLEEISQGYDVVLIEADGSKSLPCKGWKEDEPVIPCFTTHTIGIVTLNGLDKMVDDTTVLRLEEFFNLTGKSKGDIVTKEDLTKMVCNDKGMFYKSKGEKYIFVNQIEDNTSVEIAEKWLDELHNTYDFDFFAYGSAIENKWVEVKY